MPTTPIPLVLVTGFLGSGKTTVLERFVEQYRDRRIVYLVNEFSPLDVDGRRLHLPEQQLVSIAGGSIFCRCLVTQFIGVLTRVATMAGFAPEGVIIEASGIASPKVIQQMLAETRLDQRYSLTTILTVVDPGTFQKLLSTLPNIRDQVEAADLVLLNKIDLYDEKAIASTEESIRTIRPDVPIRRVSFGQADLDPLAISPSSRTLLGEHARCVDPHYACLTPIFRCVLSLPALQGALATLGDALYRVKGFIETTEGRRYLDYAFGQWNERPAEEADGRLILIVRGGAEAKARAILDQWGVEVSLP